MTANANSTFQTEWLLLWSSHTECNAFVNEISTHSDCSSATRQEKQEYSHFLHPFRCSVAFSGKAAAQWLLTCTSYWWDSNLSGQNQPGLLYSCPYAHWINTGERDCLNKWHDSHGSAKWTQREKTTSFVLAPQTSSPAGWDMPADGFCYSLNPIKEHFDTSLLPFSSMHTCRFLGHQWSCVQLTKCTPFGPTCVEGR